MKHLILGYRGMVGSAVGRLLPFADVHIADDIDLRNSVEARAALRSPTGPYDVLWLCAAKVGGIEANRARPGEFIYDNLMIQANVIESARVAGVKLLVFLGSSCIYPRTLRLDSWHETDLMSGPLEPTNSAYATAKLAGIEMLRVYERQYGMRSLILIPCNLYGPGDKYDLETSHFIPAMIRKFHEAKLAGATDPVTLWGSGAPRREFMHVDDMASAAVYLVRQGCTGIYNIGTGKDLSILEAACWIANIVCPGLEEIAWDRSRLDGVARKLLNVSKLHAAGWNNCRSFDEGIRQTYKAYKSTL